MYYFDHAASTVVYPQVIEDMAKSFLEDFANPSANHAAGKLCAKKIDDARITLLKSVDASNKYNFIFTSSATESNNQVIRSFKEGIYFLEGDHPSVTKVIDGGEGFKTLEGLISQIDSEAKLVCLSLVNSQSGEILDVNAAAKKVKEIAPRCLVHVDATQGFGKVPLSLCDNSIDYVTIGGHKMGAPRGIAGLFFKPDFPVLKYLRGGSHELGLRASTPSTPLILSLASASQIAMENLDESYERVDKLKSSVKDGLASLHKNISFPFEDRKTSPYILCVQFEGIVSDVLMRHLEVKNVMISSSTACSAKIKGKNPLFEGLGIEEKYHKNILRISLGKTTTDSDVRGLLEGFKEVIDEIGFLIK